MSTWKPKSKKHLNREETIELAFHNSEKAWVGSQPLFTAYQFEGSTYFQFAHPEQANKKWLLLFVDPTDFAGQKTLSCVEDIYKRFYACGVSLALLISTQYQEFYSGVEGHLAVQQQIIRKFHLSLPTVLDYGQTLTTLFRAHSPQLILLNEGKVALNFTGEKIFSEFEEALQTLIHKTDPGVAFRPRAELGKGLPTAANPAMLEFGSAAPPAVRAQFPAPGFSAPGPGTFKTGQFTQPALSGPQSVALTGAWLQDAERIVTMDPKATISFSCPSPMVSLVAHAVSKSASRDANEFLAADIFLEINDGPPAESFLAPGVTLRLDGTAFQKVSRAGFYPLLAGLNRDCQKITLRFENAHEVPIALYGLRFGR